MKMANFQTGWLTPHPPDLKQGSVLSLAASVVFQPATMPVFQLSNFKLEKEDFSKSLKNPNCRSFIFLHPRSTLQGLSACLLYVCLSSSLIKVYLYQRILSGPGNNLIIPPTSTY